MEQLNPLPTASQYKELDGKIALLGNVVVNVYCYEKHSQSGSYERGFKYTDSTYGYLTKKLKGTKYYKPTRYSPDHGKTWYDTFEDAKKQRAGKVLVERRNNKEFAFESIQRINRDYDPQYKWKP